MFGDASHADLRVFRVNPAEHDQCLGMIKYGLPTVLMFVEKFQEILTENVGHDRLRAAG